MARRRRTNERFVAGWGGEGKGRTGGLGEEGIREDSQSVVGLL